MHVSLVFLGQLSKREVREDMGPQWVHAIHVHGSNGVALWKRRVGDVVHNFLAS